MGVLDGQVAIVTGVGTGLGRGIAQQLAEAGASIPVVEEGPHAGIAADELAQSRRGSCLSSRVGKEVNDAFAAVVRDFGRLDITVNNAGISRVGPHTQCTDEDWHDSIAVMQSGVFFCHAAQAGGAPA